mmetsp:Transcript_23815/g.77430  ORF Transcript_23815/g.77430 Transcript_23815/m.77430 type:complete len:243 (+) Transcript_23815:882-1610(+)
MSGARRAHAHAMLGTRSSGCCMRKSCAAMHAWSSGGLSSSMQALPMTTTGWVGSVLNPNTCGSVDCLMYTTGALEWRMSAASTTKRWSCGSCSSVTITPRSTAAICSAKTGLSAKAKMVSMPATWSSFSCASSRKGWRSSSRSRRSGTRFSTSIARSRASAWPIRCMLIPSKPLSLMSGTMPCCCPSGGRFMSTLAVSSTVSSASLMSPHAAPNRKTSGWLLWCQSEAVNSARLCAVRSGKP